MKLKPTKIVSIITIILSLVCFLALAILVINKHSFFIDKFNYFVAEHRNNFFSVFFKIITVLGSVYALGFISLMLLAICKNRRLGIFTILNLIALALLVVIIKYIVRRARPNLMLVSETGYSFPSAHAMLMMAVFVPLTYFALKYIKNKPLKIYLVVQNVLLILLISFSRIYLGVHFVSDILAGLFCGLGVSMLNILLFNKFIGFNKKS